MTTTTTPSARLMSHWQQGCDDAKADRAPRRPHADNSGLAAPLDHDQVQANSGYMKGWRFGVERRYEPTEDEGSEP